MGCSVNELLARFSSRELSEWRAYEQVTGPIGQERGDWLAGVVASTQANSAMGKRGKRLSPRDFILKWDDKAKQTVDEQLELVRAINAHFGGTDETQKEG